jgi:hypothetical protein
MAGLEPPYPGPGRFELEAREGAPLMFVAAPSKERHPKHVLLGWRTPRQQTASAVFMGHAREGMELEAVFVEPTANVARNGPQQVLVTLAPEGLQGRLRVTAETGEEAHTLYSGTQCAGEHVVRLTGKALEADSVAAVWAVRHAKAKAETAL